MNLAELQKDIAWLQHEDIRTFLASDDVPGPWFPAYLSTKSVDQKLTRFSALVPPALIPKLVRNSGVWDIRIGDGGPATHWSGGSDQQTYTPFGNDDGIEPLVIYRSFHGLRDCFLELAQEFRLYHNLYPEPSRKRFLLIDDNGDESEAARYGDDFLEIRTDLLLRFCAVKQMALAIYVDSFRDSKSTLKELGLTEMHTHHDGHGTTVSLIWLHWTAFSKEILKPAVASSERSMSCRDRYLLRKRKSPSCIRSSPLIRTDPESLFVTRAIRTRLRTTSAKTRTRPTTLHPYSSVPRSSPSTTPNPENIWSRTATFVVAACGSCRWTMTIQTLWSSSLATWAATFRKQKETTG
jgi:hypothetical protein